MATPISTGAHPKALWPGVKKWTHLQYSEKPLQYSTIFNSMSSDKAYEEMVEATGFGLAQIKPEGQSTTYDSHSQGPVTRARHVAYSLGYIVTKEEIADNKYPQLARSRSRALAFSFRQTKEQVHANVLNRAFNSSYTYGDGKELCATDHPIYAGGTQSNELSVAADISEAAIEDLLILIRQAKNNRGLQIQLRPVRLIVHPADMFDAVRIVQSTLQSGTANNDTNAMREMGMLNSAPFVYDYLTDEHAFFIQTDAPDGLTTFERQAFEFTRDNDFDTENAKAKGYERYATTVADWRCIFGSEGAS